MISIKKATKSINKAIEEVDDEKCKENLTKLLEDYIDLYEKREKSLKIMEKHRNETKTDEEKKKKFNLYHKQYYHDVLKKKKEQEQE